MELKVLEVGHFMTKANISHNASVSHGYYKTVLLSVGLQVFAESCLYNKLPAVASIRHPHPLLVFVSCFQIARLILAFVKKMQISLFWVLITKKGLPKIAFVTHCKVMGHSGGQYSAGETEPKFCRQNWTIEITSWFK